MIDLHEIASEIACYIHAPNEIHEAIDSHEQAADLTFAQTEELHGLIFDDLHHSATLSLEEHLEEWKDDEYEDDQFEADLDWYNADFGDRAQMSFADYQREWKHKYQCDDCEVWFEHSGDSLSQTHCPKCYYFKASERPATAYRDVHVYHPGMLPKVKAMIGVHVTDELLESSSSEVDTCPIAKVWHETTNLYPVVHPGSTYLFRTPWDQQRYVHCLNHAHDLDAMKHPDQFGLGRYLVEEIPHSEYLNAWIQAYDEEGGFAVKLNFDKYGDLSIDNPKERWDSLVEYLDT